MFNARLPRDCGVGVCLGGERAVCVCFLCSLFLFYCGGDFLCVSVLFLTITLSVFKLSSLLMIILPFLLVLSLHLLHFY